MILSPLLSASPIVQLHVVAALCAIVFGPFAIWRRSRDIWHKRLGYVWVTSIAVTAISSFGILEGRMLGAFSPIHALSVFTLWSLWRAVNAARQGRTEQHQKGMKALYFWAMGVAGLFTFLPGRRMNSVFFSDAPMSGFIAMTAVIAMGLAWYVYADRRADPQQ